MRNCVATALAIVALCVVAACGDEEPTENSGTNNTTGVAICAAGAFEETVVFDHAGALPFSYEVPVGFESLDSSTDGVVAGSTHDRTATGQRGEFVNLFSIVRASTTPEVAANAEQAWVDAGSVEIAIPYDGGTLRGYETVFEDRSTVNAYLPVGTELHQLTLQWSAPESCAAERQAIRDRALETLAPNPEASFP